MQEDINFVHLHVHTHYSLLDGAIKLDDLLRKAESFNQKAVAMTDHGNMHGAVEFYITAKDFNVKPIIGCELYVAPKDRFERKTLANGGGGTFHIIALAMDDAGYRNLCKLTSLSYKEGFYFKPRVDWELLSKYNEGLIISSACLQGEIPFLIRAGKEQELKNTLDFYNTTFKDRFYLEIQPHQNREQQETNKRIFELSKEYNIPIIPTCDAHYLEKEDSMSQEILMCIATQKQLSDENRMSFEGFDLHLRSTKEILEDFKDYPIKEAMANTVKIADMCETKFNFSIHYMPVYKSDDPELKNRPFIEIMSEQARNGLKARLEIISKSKDYTKELEKVYIDRLEREISLIDSMGFAGYFLVVSDFIVWSKQNGVPVGPGRGSCAGSLVAYAMQITDIDPIRHDLLFERFLNPDRITLPDIDVDFCVQGREKVLEYVSNKYGKDNVAQIATFGTLKAKNAIKDVGRVLGVSYQETDRVASLIPNQRQGAEVDIKRALELEPKLKEYAENDGQELMRHAMKLEGLTRHASTHAAGVIIADRPLSDIVPLMIDKFGHDVTQYSMKYVEKVGLVKFDFLGLKTLTVIKTALDIIKGSRGETVDLSHIPLDDEKVFELLRAGDTVGVFQLESSGITDITVRIAPTRFEDLVALNALYRPGPLDAGMVDRYIERKHGREKVEYEHPLLADILKDTYGIMIYQEQIMQIARTLANFTLSEADLLRRAMGKKIAEEMAEQKPAFIKGCVSNNISKKVAETVFSQMETFARYGFNKSHSAAYALITYQTAYLKAHYLVEFMAAVMSHEADDTDKVLKNFNECKKHGIKILPPDVNKSYANFSVNAGKIRFGLSAIKAVGEKAVLAIIEEREKCGEYKDLEDLVLRVPVSALNKRVLENLIKSGAFDFSGVSKNENLMILDFVLKQASAIQKEKDAEQVSLFDFCEGSYTIERKRSNMLEFSSNVLLSLEKEALGFYISGHPLYKYKMLLKKLNVISINVAKEKPPKNVNSISLAGVVTFLKLKNTRKGERYANFLLEDDTGSIETFVWPDAYRKIGESLEREEPLLVSGKLDITENRTTFIASEAKVLSEVRRGKASSVIITIDDLEEFRSKKKDFKEIVRKNEGNCPLKIMLNLDDERVLLQLKDISSNNINVSATDDFSDELEQNFASVNVDFV
ncbi:MAG: DNA polymerase III subunit alpha [Bdellovibrionota bacterium]